MVLHPQYKFRIYLSLPEKKHCTYFVVHIWEKHTDFVSAIAKRNNIYALTIQNHTPTKKISKVIHLHFWIKRMGFEFTAHELTHALNFWIERNKLQIHYNKCWKEEELSALAKGQLTKKFYQKLFKLGITDRPDLLKSKSLE